MILGSNSQRFTKTVCPSKDLGFKLLIPTTIYDRSLKKILFSPFSAQVTISLNRIKQNDENKQITKSLQHEVLQRVSMTMSMIHIYVL